MTVSIDIPLYLLDFPSRKPVIAELPELISKALSKLPFETYKARDYLLVYDNEQKVKDIRIDRLLFDKINLDPGGVIVTAKGT